MLIRVKESNKIYSIEIYGLKDQQWSPSFADDVLTDVWMLEHQTEDFREGYTLTQKEFAEFTANLKADEESYNNGSTAGEWLERNEEYPQDNFESIDVRIEYTYTYED